jgi:hypothetical protein
MKIVPVARLKGFEIFDDGDRNTLATDSISVLVADLGRDQHSDAEWFELKTL